MPEYTGDGKALIAWDGGCGPTWARDPFDRPIKAKFLGTCEVFRSVDDKPAVSIGETEAEAFFDEQVENFSCVSYWVMEHVAGGGLRQIGPTIDMQLPSPDTYEDKTPPSPVNELRARRKGKGNELSWLPACDDESGVLAYLVYCSNEDQPDAVIWVDDPLDRPAYGTSTDPTEEEYALGESDPIWERDENGDVIIDQWGNRKAKQHARMKWLDRTPDGKKPYIMRVLDNCLNVSEPTGKVDPWTGEPPATPGKEREPVEPVVPEGVIYISETTTNRISELDGTTATTITGGDEEGDYVDGTLAEARFDTPLDIAMDSEGNVFVCDLMNCVIRKVDVSNDEVTTFAGVQGADNVLDGPAVTAHFERPRAIAIDVNDSDQMWVADTSYDMRRILRSETWGWETSTIVGKPGWYGNVDGTGVAVSVPIVQVSDGVTHVDPPPSYIEQNYHYRYTCETAEAHNFLSGDIVETVPTWWSGWWPSAVCRVAVEVVDATHYYYYLPLGPHTGGFHPDGGGYAFLWDSDNPNGRTFSAMDYVHSVAVDDEGSAYFTQYGGVVRRVTKEGVLTTVAGHYYQEGTADGTGEDARFSWNVWGITVDDDGNLLVADYTNHTIRKVTPEGVVTTVLGVAGDGNRADGNAATARLRYPWSVRWAGGDLYIGEADYDLGYGLMRVWDGTTLTTLAGTPEELGQADGEGSAAHFPTISSLAGY
jgi:hypothetical protein